MTFKVISTASTKGGVGKTTTAVSLAYALGQAQDTLLIDLDPQGQVAAWYGQDSRSNVFDWWVENEALDHCVVPARPAGKLWLMLGNSRSRVVEKMYRDLTTQQYNLFVGAIRKLSSHFAYIIIDTAPGGVMQEVAMGASDHVIVPFRAERPGVLGALATLDMLNALHHSAKITLLAVDYYASVGEQKRSLAEFQGELGMGLFAPRPIPHRIAVAEACAEGKTPFEYRGGNIRDVQVAYGYLIREIAPEWQWDFGLEANKKEMFSEAQG